MAIYRSDQAQLTFAAESAQGADPERIEGNRNTTHSSGPTGLLNGAHTAGSRSLTISAEFTALINGSGTAILMNEASNINSSTTSVDVDSSHAIKAGRIIQIDSEQMLVTAVSTNELTVTRAYNGSTAASHNDNAPIKMKFQVGDFIMIGTLGTAASSQNETEVRRVEASSGTTITLDRPTSFYHPTSSEIRTISGVSSASDARNDNDKYITFIPGIYETIDTPDPEMSIEGRRFLNTASKRNFSVAYAGQQTLTGSVSGIMLLNGWPLRFPIGNVVTTPSHLSGGTLSLAADANKGDVFVTLSGSTGLDPTAAGSNYININDGSSTKSEVRRLVANPSGNIFKLNYPLQFAHTSGDSIDKVSSTASGIYYDHVINEAVNLDTVSWHIHMKDSDSAAGTTTKHFDRRFVGGMVGSSTITAEEGGMVTMSWDSVNFTNMIHQQFNQKDLGTGGSNAPQLGDLYYGASQLGSGASLVPANMPRVGVMQAIDTDDIGEPSHNGTGVNDGSGYPTTQPYYFSEGTIKFFGQEFARIRSFSLSITNNEEPRYYIGKQGARARGPYEIREGARDYGMSASIALPDADVAHNATAANSTQSSALELFRQLLLEGNYGGDSPNMKGFTATIKFERGTNDFIIIDIPGSTTAGTPTDTGSSLNSQGIFINSAPHSITTDNPFQIDVDMIFRSLKITVRDNVPVYP